MIRIFTACILCYTVPMIGQSSLKEKFSNAFMIGAALHEDIFLGKDDASSAIVIQENNSITAENVMKAETICPRENEYHFEKADAFVDFGQKHKMFMIGHTLVWHNQCPDWFFIDNKGKSKDSTEVLKSLGSYISTVVSRYKNKIQAWDVVNEVIGDDGEYRKTKWVNAVGSGDLLVSYAFSKAAEADPEAELYYNDFNAWKPKKRDGIIRMVKMLKSKGVKIDGIGIQGHWGLNYPNETYIRQAIEAYAAEGLKVMITELDIDVLPLTKEGQIIGACFSHEQFQEEEFMNFLNPYPKELPADMQHLLAERYGHLFSLFYEYRNVISRVTLWGVHDGNSWKNDYPIPNRTNYTLLWDRNKKPKPAYHHILRLSLDK